MFPPSQTRGNFEGHDLLLPYTHPCKDTTIFYLSTMAQLSFYLSTINNMKVKSNGMKLHGVLQLAKIPSSPLLGTTFTSFAICIGLKIIIFVSALDILLAPRKIHCILNHFFSVVDLALDKDIFSVRMDLINQCYKFRLFWKALL